MERLTITDTGGNRMAENYQKYDYLEQEDILFCKAFRLTEDQFLEMAGGLKSYTEFRLNRSQTRGATMTAFSGETMTFDVPRLPSDTEEAMSLIKMPGLREEECAAYVLKEQMDKVAGIMGALRANISFKAEVDRQDEEKSAIRAADKIRLAKLNPYGWVSDSQSALDWAEARLKQQRR